MDLEEAGRLYAEGRVQAERLDDAAQLASIIFADGSTNFFRGAVRIGCERYLEAARLFDETDDGDAQAGLWAVTAWSLCWVGPVEAGNQARERSLALAGGNAGAGVSVLGFGAPAVCVGIAGALLLALVGRYDDAWRGVDEGLAMARARHESESIAWTLSMYARLARTRNDFEASWKSAHEALRIAEDSGNITNHVVTLGAAGTAELGLGDFGQAIETLEQALTLGRQHQAGLFEEVRLLVDLARARLGLGDVAAAGRAASEAVEVARRQGTPIFECLALLTRARVRRAAGGTPDEVDADLAVALRLARETGATAYAQEIKTLGKE